MKRKKKRIQITIMYFVILILLGIIGFGTYLSLNAHFRNKVEGTWELKVDMSESVVSAVNGWLDDYELIDFTFSPVIIKASFEKEGTYKIYIDEDSYSAYVESAHEYVKKRFSLVVESSLLMAGYEGSDISSVSEELIDETIEGDLGTYLEENGVELSKPVESLDKYVSEGSYEYKRKEKLLTLTENSGSVKTINIDISKDVLVLKNEDGEDNGSDTLYPVTFTRVE